MVSKVCCIVYREDYNGLWFLLLHRNNWWNGWEFVRGDVLSGESHGDAVVRGLNELTGIGVKKVDSVAFSFNYDYLKGLNEVSADVSCFIAKARDEVVNISSEHDYYKWVDYETALGLLDFEEQKKLLCQVYKRITPL